MPRRNNTPPFARKATQSPQKTCSPKKRYSNETEARRAAELSNLKQRDVTLDCYRCNQCGKWHLTSRLRSSS